MFQIYTKLQPLMLLVSTKLIPRFDFLSYDPFSLLHLPHSLLWPLLLIYFANMYQKLSILEYLIPNIDHFANQIPVMAVLY